MISRKKLTRKEVSRDRVSLDGLPRTCGSFFLDSGAHSLYTIHVIAKHHVNEYNWYKTRAFVHYVDAYANFIKKYKDGLDWYANVDVIFNPQLTWEVQRYLEDKHGLKPVPVIHYGTDLIWIDHYLRRGHKFLGVGGLGQEATALDYMKWADRFYAHLCDTHDYCPAVKTHGFAMTSYRLMIRYPWWSVDSASWAKAAGFGSIYVPHKRGGKFTFEEKPYNIGFSHRSDAAKIKGKHYLTLNPNEKKIVLEWLEKIDIPLGSMSDGRVEEYGVFSQYNARATANLKFFEELCNWLPQWPWPFKIKPRRGFFG